MQQDLRKLQQRLGITFKQQGLLKQAFTHASYVNEQRVSREMDNERIEYLGDAVLELAVSEFLYRQHPSLPEGELTKLRASIVCEASLVHFAEELDFGSFVFLGRGEEMTGGRMRPALLADVYEAFIGALYLDQGMHAVVSFLEESMFPRLSDEGKPHFFDYKTQLQEIAQQHNLGAVEYRIIEERGPAHERQFVSQVFVNQECVGQGTGRSKKEAEQQAADQAVQRIQLQRSNRTVSGE